MTAEANGQVHKIGRPYRVKYVRQGQTRYWHPNAIVHIIAIPRLFDSCDWPWEMWSDPIVADCTVICKNGDLAHPLFDQLEPLVDNGDGWANLTTIYRPGQKMKRSSKVRVALS